MMHHPIYLLLGVITRNMKDKEVVTQVADRHTYKKESLLKFQARVKLSLQIMMLILSNCLTRHLSERRNLSAA